MLEVKVTVELPGIAESLNNLANAIANRGFANANMMFAKAETTPAVVPAPVAPVAPVTPVTSVAPVMPVPVEETPAPVAVETAPAPVPVAPDPVTPAPVSSQPTVTMHALSTAGAKLVEIGKMDAVINLLKNYGVPAITSLKPEQYDSFAAGLTALGATI